MQYSLWYAVPNTLPVGDLVTEELTEYWVQHTTSCSLQSNAPEDGQNCCPKHVELNWIYQQNRYCCTLCFSFRAS